MNDKMYDLMVLTQRRIWYAFLSLCVKFAETSKDREQRVLQVWRVGLLYDSWMQKTGLGEGIYFDRFALWMFENLYQAAHEGINEERPYSETCQEYRSMWERLMAIERLYDCFGIDPNSWYDD